MHVIMRVSNLGSANLSNSVIICLVWPKLSHSLDEAIWPKMGPVWCCPSFDSSPVAFPADHLRLIPMKSQVSNHSWGRKPRYKHFTTCTCITVANIRLAKGRQRQCQSRKIETLMPFPGTKTSKGRWQRRMIHPV